MSEWSEWSTLPPPPRGRGRGGQAGRVECLPRPHLRRRPASRVLKECGASMVPAPKPYWRQVVIILGGGVVQPRVRLGNKVERSETPPHLDSSQLLQVPEGKRNDTKVKKWLWAASVEGVKKARCRWPSHNLDVNCTCHVRKWFNMKRCHPYPHAVGTRGCYNCCHEMLICRFSHWVQTHEIGATFA